jgi:hypothetical protein
MGLWQRLTLRRRGKGPAPAGGSGAGETSHVARDPGPDEEGTAALLRWCDGVRELRPRYALLGSAGELLARSETARAALRRLLAAGLREPLAADSARVLGALAWAACVSGEEQAVRELGRVLRHHAGDRFGERPEAEAHFLRAGLAALAALAGEPGTGAHHRVLAAQSREAVAAAREELGLLRAAPPEWEGLGPEYGLGDWTAVLTVWPDGRVTLGFRDARGRTVRRVPARVRERRPVAYAALRVRLAEVRARVDAYRGSLSERLHADPGQPAARWAAACLDDPALEPLSRAVLWEADLPDGPVVGCPVPRPEGLRWALLDLRQRTHELPPAAAVRLWDPRTADAVEAAAWRAELRRRGAAAQPVPQLPWA